jgi:hypothetical protein
MVPHSLPSGAKPEPVGLIVRCKTRTRRFDCNGIEHLLYMVLTSSDENGIEVN